MWCGPGRAPVAGVVAAAAATTVDADIITTIIRSARPTTTTPFRCSHRVRHDAGRVR